MNPDRFTTTLGDLVTSKLADVHTAVPARLTSINYGSGKGSAQPLVKTAIGTSKTIPYPELLDIPIIVQSGNGGKAKITFPIKPGDTVLVVFSERDPSNFLSGNNGDNLSEPAQRTYLGLYPIAIVPCLSAGNSSTEIDSENLVIANDQSKFTLYPDGTIIIENSGGKIEMGSDGTINLNGLKISPTGQLTLVDGSVVDKHTHGGVESGGSSTNPLGS
ncbi:TPA: hypothetical protein MCM29_005582 [Klebsiella pneumoniae]|nr:hypothetical protein [Klebsiella pneumoniae]